MRQFILLTCILVIAAEKNNSMKDLVESLKSQNIIRSKIVEEVMLQVDRQFFVPEGIDPYEDSPQPIGFGATISAPHMHAYALEALKDHLDGASKCLDVGSGSGYLTIAMRLLMKKHKNSFVFGVEHVEQLRDQAEENIINAGFSFYLEEYKVFIQKMDGRQGVKRQAPFDCIHIGAGKQNLIGNYLIIASLEYPQVFVDQLKKGGRLIVPVGQNIQEFLQIDKDLSGKVSLKKFFDVRYIPLVSLEEQCPECFKEEQERLEKQRKQQEQNDDGSFDFNFDL